jgi:ubiquinone biosynthesis protein COQ4
MIRSHCRQVRRAASGALVASSTTTPTASKNAQDAAQSTGAVVTTVVVQTTGERLSSHKYTRFLHSSTVVKNKREPFYGSPRPPRKGPPFAASTPFPNFLFDFSSSNDNTRKNHNSIIQLAIENAIIAWQDPTRADAVAAVGELTGHFALQKLLQAMKEHETGRVLLMERPLVSKATVPHNNNNNNNNHSEWIERDSLSDQLHEQNVVNKRVERDDTTTFGQAYATFLNRHGFDPDERDPIHYLLSYDDDNDSTSDAAAEMAYVMLRYRQCHDFWHVLTGLPPTVVGELALKWLELFQTGLPVAAISCLAGPFHFLKPLASSSSSLPNMNNINDLYTLHGTLLPWAVRQGQNMPFGSLMNVYYEREWETPLHELRTRLNLHPAPTTAIIRR